MVRLLLFAFPLTLLLFLVSIGLLNRMMERTLEEAPGPQVGLPEVANLPRAGELWVLSATFAIFLLLL
jgi:hypothetical protein